MTSNTIIYSIARRNFRFLRTLFSYLSTVNIWLVQIFFIFSSKWCLQSRFLNRLGMQVLRIRLADKIWRARREKFNNKFKTKNIPKLSHALEELDKKGLVKVESALPDDMYRIAKRVAEDMKSGDIDFKSFVKAGAEYREVVVKDVAPELNCFLNNHFWLNDCVKSYLAKNKLGFLWRIKLVRDYDDTFDKNTLFHADTYFSTLKSFIYLDHVPKEQDVYNYLIGSHVMTQEILSLHRKYSIKLNSAPWPSDAEIGSLKYEQFLEDISPNTMVLSDTRGIHRRHPKTNPSDKWRATLFCSFRSSPFSG